MINTILIVSFGMLVFWLIGLWVKYTTAGYVSLENRGKSLFQNLYEGIVGFFKIFF